MTLKVIGAGFGRTGTRSMKAAFEQLGFGPCYHMGEVIAPNPGCNEGHLDAWHDFWVRGASMDWKWLMQHYGACVDFPTCLYYRELMAAFPDALVVLNTRDPEKWFDSWQHLWSAVDTVCDPDRVVRFQKWVEVAQALRDRFFGGRIEHDTNIAVFNAHNEAVRREVPAGRLLEFNVQQGWAPLCEFLGVPVPDAPFPHLNEREGMLELLQLLLWTNEPVSY